MVEDVESYTIWPIACRGRARCSRLRFPSRRYSKACGEATSADCARLAGASYSGHREPNQRMTPVRDIRRELTAVPESPLVQIATLAESMPGSIKLCYGESDLPTPRFI